MFKFTIGLHECTIINVESAQVSICSWTIQFY